MRQWNYHLLMFRNRLRGLPNRWRHARPCLGAFMAQMFGVWSGPADDTIIQTYQWRGWQYVIPPAPINVRRKS